MKLTKADLKELAQEGGHEFSITTATLSCDSVLIKKLIENGARIEHAKRVRADFRGRLDGPRRDLIYMSLPLKRYNPTVEGLKFGLVLYVHASANEISRIKTVINFAAIDVETERFMLFGPEFEYNVKMNEKWDIGKKDLTAALDSFDEFISKLDRFIITLQNDSPNREGLGALNRELIGTMIRTARRTTEVVNIDTFNNKEALKITNKLARTSWAKQKTKFQLWRIAFNNVFDIDLVNSLGIEYRLNDEVVVMTKKYKGDETISVMHEIPIIELIARTLIVTQVTPKNYESLVLPSRFNIANYI